MKRKLLITLSLLLLLAITSMSVLPREFGEKSSPKADIIIIKITIGSWIDVFAPGIMHIRLCVSTTQKDCRVSEKVVVPA